MPTLPTEVRYHFYKVPFGQLTTQPTIVSGHFSFQIPFAKCPHCPLVFYGSFKVPFDKLTALPTADGGQISSKYHNLCGPHCSSTVSYLFIIVLFDKLTRQPTIVSGHFSFQVPFADCPHCPLMLVVFFPKVPFDKLTTLPTDELPFAKQMGSVVNLEYGTLKKLGLFFCFNYFAS